MEQQVSLHFNNNTNTKFGTPKYYYIRKYLTFLLFQELIKERHVRVHTLTFS